MEIKGYLQSRSVWGLLVIAVTWAARAIWPDADPTSVEATLTALAESAGYLIAVWGTLARRDLSGVWRGGAA